MEFAVWGPWALFSGVIVALLLFDLLVVHRADKEMSIKEAAWWSVFWVGLAAAFGAGVWVWRGAQAGQEFFAAYLLEKSLSVDNLFVFVLIFSALGISAVYQHKVLFWGILGAIVFRLAFIFGGIALLEQFHWVIYVFGAFLLVTAVKMWRSSEHGADPQRSLVVRLAERFLPVDCSVTGPGFTLRREGRTVLTALALALIAVESADLVFAVDSVPAVLAISADPFIVFTSNVFAILGLRSLYFALVGCIDRFRYLHYGLALVLGFVGAKMLLVDVVHVPVGLSVALIVGAVAATIGYSVWKTRNDACAVPTALEPDEA